MTISLWHGWTQFPHWFSEMRSQLELLGKDSTHSYRAAVPAGCQPWAAGSHPLLWWRGSSWKWNDTRMQSKKRRETDSGYHHLNTWIPPNQNPGHFSYMRKTFPPTPFFVGVSLFKLDFSPLSLKEFWFIQGFILFPPAFCWLTLSIAFIVKSCVKEEQYVHASDGDISLYLQTGPGTRHVLGRQRH